MRNYFQAGFADELTKIAFFVVIPVPDKGDVEGQRNLGAVLGAGVLGAGGAVAGAALGKKYLARIPAMKKIIDRMSIRRMVAQDRSNRAFYSGGRNPFPLSPAQAEMEATQQLGAIPGLLLGGTAGGIAGAKWGRRHGEREQEKRKAVHRQDTEKHLEELLEMERQSNKEREAWVRKYGPPKQKLDDPLRQRIVQLQHRLKTMDGEDS